MITEFRSTFYFLHFHDIIGHFKSLLSTKLMFPVLSHENVIKIFEMVHSSSLDEHQTNHLPF